MIFNKIYKIIYFLMAISIVIMIATPIILKMKLQNLKAMDKVEFDYVMSNKEELKKNNIPLYDVISIINSIDEVSIENISLNDGYKEITLNSCVSVNIIKEIIQEFILMDEVIDVMEVKFKEKNWTIMMLFN